MNVDEVENGRQNHDHVYRDLRHFEYGCFRLDPRSGNDITMSFGGKLLHIHSRIINRTAQIFAQAYKARRTQAIQKWDECDLSIDSTIDDWCYQLFDVEMLTFMPQKLIKLFTVVMSTVKMDTVRSSGKPVQTSVHLFVPHTYERKHTFNIQNKITISMVTNI